LAEFDAWLVEALSTRHPAFSHLPLCTRRAEC
jgi:hypothetical protein